MKKEILDIAKKILSPLLDLVVLYPIQAFNRFSHTIKEFFYENKGVFILVTACLLLIISFYFFFHSRTFTEAKIDLSLYVSPDGDDQNEGTKSSPLRTLNEAATRAKLGTTVFVRKGTYNELLSIKHSGTASKPITFTNYKNEKVIISGSHIQDLKEDTALIKIENKDYITIQGFTLEELATTQDEPTVMDLPLWGFTLLAVAAISD